MIQDIIRDISKIVDKDNITGKSAQAIAKIKNMMIDRHIVNRSLKEHLEKWRLECLPLVIANFETFPEDVRIIFL